MLKQHKIFGLIPVFILLLIFCFLGGCTQSETLGPDLDSQQDVEQNGQPEQGEPTERTFTDDAGRVFTIPTEINKVYCTDPKGTMLIYSINPDKLAGWNSEISPIEKKYFPEEYHNIQNLGGWQGTQTGNVEEILRAEPDICIFVIEIKQSNIELADKIQEQLDIPVLILDMDISKFDRLYEVLGELINEEEITDVYSKYCREVLDDITEKSKQIPDEERLRVYYAEGPKGLNTDPAGSFHTQVLDMVRGSNVADVEIPGARVGMVEVSLEQILQWDPEVILCSNTKEQGGYREGILSNPDWQDITAVKNKKVYEIPYAPFSWFDRPPSINRILGLKWLSNLLYPEVYDYDIAKEAKEFYEMFYHYKLTDEEVAEILKNAS